jgi:hypothetical protein
VVSAMTAHEVLARLVAYDRARGVTSPIPIDLDLADRLVAEHAQVRQGVQIAPPITDGTWQNAGHPALDVRPDGSTERTP